MADTKIYWLTQSLPDVPGTNDWLHPSELRIANGFRFQKKRNDYLLGRWTAKQAVKSYLKASHPQLSFAEIEIRKAPDGAPEAFCDNDLLPVYLSLSHSHGIGLCAIAPTGIIHGCDIEKVEPRSDAFIQDYFTENEKEFILSDNKDLKNIRANLLWSIKESTLKAMRTGLKVDPIRLEVKIPSQRDDYSLGRNVVEVEYNTEELHGCWMKRNDFLFTFIYFEQHIIPTNLFA